MFLIVLFAISTFEIITTLSELIANWFKWFKAFFLLAIACCHKIKGGIKYSLTESMKATMTASP